MKIQNLDEISLNTKVKIEKLVCQGPIRRRLLDLGLVEGTEILPILRSPSGDPVAYAIRGSVIALRKEDASQIKVKR